MNDVKMRLLVCGGPECRDERGEAVREALRNEIVRKGLDGRVELVESECLALCGVGPVMRVEPGDIVYQKLTPEVIPQLVEEHLVKGRPLKKLLYEEPAPPESIPKMDAIPFFRHQSLWVMRNKGAIDPEIIDEYIARDGYIGAAKALLEMTPAADRRGDQELGPAGSRGRRVPHRLKWEFAQQATGRRQVRALQRRRGRPRGVHGPQRPGGRPPRRARGHAHRRLRHRRAPGLYLRAGGVPAGGQAAEHRHPARRGSTGCSGKRHPGHRL